VNSEHCGETGGWQDNRQLKASWLTTKKEYNIYEKS
jgi:hypothetical protein